MYPTRLLLLAASAVVLAGCGGEPTYDVTGTVQLADGTPLAAGQVELQAVDRPVSAVGYIQPDGSFRLNMLGEGDGAFAGQYRVAVKPPPVPTLIPGDEAKNQQMLAARETWLEQVPARYHTPESSPLEFAVSKDAAENRLEIVIEP